MIVCIVTVVIEHVRVSWSDKTESYVSRAIIRYLTLDRIATRQTHVGKEAWIDTVIGYCIGIHTIVQQFQDFKFFVRFLDVRSDKERKYYNKYWIPYIKQSY